MTSTPTTAELHAHVINEGHISKHQRGENIRLLNWAADEIDKFVARLDEGDGMMEWRPIETAPKDGTEFLALIDGLPYKAKYDEHGRFIWYWHINMADGAVHKLAHDQNGGEIWVKVKDAGNSRYEPRGSLWVLGFDNTPTHWLPLPESPK